jgi:hypothetical protein
MTDDKGSEFSSPFDAMLKRDRDRLERLYGGSLPETERSAAVVEPASPRPVAPRRRAAVTTNRLDRTVPSTPAGEIRGSADGIPFSFRPSD